MKIKKIKCDENSLTISMEGEDHTLANLLRKKVVEAGAVASYDIGHPLVGSLKFTVKGEKPVSILEDAAKSIRKDAKEFKKKFSKQI